MVNRNPTLSEIESRLNANIGKYSPKLTSEAAIACAAFTIAGGGALCEDIEQMLYDIKTLIDMVCENRPSTLQSPLNTPDYPPGSQA